MKISKKRRMEAYSCLTTAAEAVCDKYIDGWAVLRPAGYVLEASRILKVTLPDIPERKPTKDQLWRAAIEIADAMLTVLLEAQPGCFVSKGALETEMRRAWSLLHGKEPDDETAN